MLAKYLSVNLTELVFEYLSEFIVLNQANPSDIIVNYLLVNPNKIDWYYFSQNPSEHAVDYLFKHLDKINMNGISLNSNKFNDLN